MKADFHIIAVKYGVRPDDPIIGDSMMHIFARLHCVFQDLGVFFFLVVLSTSRRIGNFQWMDC